MSIMKNWVMNFIKDERGAESTELAVTTLVVAAGSVTGYTSVRNKVSEKTDEMIDKLDTTAAD